MARGIQAKANHPYRSWALFTRKSAWRRRLPGRKDDYAPGYYNPANTRYLGISGDLRTRRNRGKTLEERRTGFAMRLRYFERRRVVSESGTAGNQTASQTSRHVSEGRDRHHPCR